MHHDNCPKSLKELCSAYCFNNIFRLKKKKLALLPHELLDELTSRPIILERIAALPITDNNPDSFIGATMAKDEDKEVTSKHFALQFNRDQFSIFPNQLIIHGRQTPPSPPLVIPIDQSSITAFNILTDPEKNEIGYLIGSEVGQVSLYDFRGEKIAAIWQHFSPLVALGQEKTKQYIVSYDESKIAIIWDFPHPLFFIVQDALFESTPDPVKSFYEDDRIKVTEELVVPENVLEKLVSYHQFTPEQKIKLLYLARLSCGGGAPFSVIEKKVTTVVGLQQTDFDGILNAKLLSLLAIKRKVDQQQTASPVTKIGNQLAKIWERMTD